MHEKTIYLLRHGQTTHDGLYVGSTDCNLSKYGENEIRSLANFTYFNNVDLVVSSPLKRCLQTFRLLKLNHELIIEDDLKEIDFGLWEGLSFEEIYKDHRLMFDQWCAEPDKFCFPDGECLQTFQDRIKGVARKLQTSKEKEILISAHGGVISHLLCALLDLPISKANIFKIETGKFAQLSMYNDSAVLHYLNKGPEIIDLKGMVNG